MTVTDIAIKKRFDFSHVLAAPTPDPLTTRDSSSSGLPKHVNITELCQTYAGTSEVI